MLRPDVAQAAVPPMYPDRELFFIFDILNIQFGSKYSLITNITGFNINKFGSKCGLVMNIAGFHINTQFGFKCD